MAAILKIYFSLLLMNRKANLLETWLEALELGRKHWGDL